jgi:hypothetical protein
MPKRKDHSATRATMAQTGSLSYAWPCALLTLGVALLAAAWLSFGLPSEEPSRSAQKHSSHTRRKSVPASAQARTEALSAEALGHFSAEHNASLLWGTYRPGTYFGLRSRTAPTGLVAGLMWAAAGSQTKPAGPLRHECEQGAVDRCVAAHPAACHATAAWTAACRPSVQVWILGP